MNRFIFIDGVQGPAVQTHGRLVKMSAGTRFTIVCSVVLALFGSVGCATASRRHHTSTSLPDPPASQVSASSNRESVTDSTYVVQPPDVLQVALVPEDQLTRNCVVRPDGFITFDLIGDVHVAGMTPPEIDDLITARLSEFIKNVEVAVSVESTRSKQFYLMGEVNRSGPMPLDGHITARDAIGLAGGFTRRASLGGVYVIRGGPGKKEVVRVNMRRVLKTGDQSGDVLLEPDDIVLVKPNGFAKVAYALDTLFMPFQGILGMAGQVATTAYTWTAQPFTGGGRISGYR